MQPLPIPPLVRSCLLVLLWFLFFADPVPAQRSILINNVEIFNGTDEETTRGNVLVVDQLISRISSDPIPVDRSANTTIIDGGGRFLMPGLIDAHVHIMLESMPQMRAFTTSYAYLALAAAKAAEKQLLRGFTSVRDMGGGAIVVQQAIDGGLAVGPRIFPSGAIISQTGGHGDFGLPADVPREIGALSYAERNGVVAIADGVDQVLVRSREQLRQGATQLKLMAGGGVASNYDPLDVAQYTEAEFRAAVSAAENWNTYVAVHAYTPKAISTAVRAGVKCIEHGQLADDTTAQLMAKAGVWWSLQPFLDDEDANPYPEGSINRQKQLRMTQGTDTAYKLAKKYNIKTAWGTDCLFNPKQAARQGARLAKMTRWYTPFEVLRMATSFNAELLGMSGPRNPYPLGPLGVVEEGAYADLLLVDGNPLENIQLLADPDNNLLLIMKGGVFYKDTISR